MNNLALSGASRQLAPLSVAYATSSPDRGKSVKGRAKNVTVRLLPLPLEEVDLRSKDGEGEAVKIRGSLFPIGLFQPQRRRVLGQQLLFGTGLRVLQQLRCLHAGAEQL